MFAAYLDVNYVQALVAPVGSTLTDISFGSSYQNGKSGSFATAGMIDEVGAFGPTSPLGPTERQLFSVRMNAKQAGTAQFTPDSAEGIGNKCWCSAKTTPWTGMPSRSCRSP